MSKPFAFCHHSSQPNILYYHFKVKSIHFLNKKACWFFSHCPIKKLNKTKKKSAKLKYFSKKYKANKNISANHIILQRMQLVWVLCIRHRKITLWEAKVTYNHYKKKKKNTGGEEEVGERWGSQVISEGLLYASFCCQIVAAKRNDWL